MNKPTAIQTITFRRDDPKGQVTCEIRVFADGSVSVLGDDIERGYEFSANAVEKATRYVESRGYVRCGQS